MNTTNAIRHILVPHDFGEPSAAALTYAERLASAVGARITLLHVVEDPAEGGDDAAELVHQLSPALGERIREVLHDALETVASRARVGGAAVAAKVRTGRPWREIDAEAAEGGVDLIVMGTHGRRGLARGLLGSVAEKVVRTAPCPVLTVHGAEQRTAA